MLAYARDLPLASNQDRIFNEDGDGTFDVYTLVSDILAIACENPKLNNTVVPALHLFNIMLEGGVFSTPEGQAGEPILDL